MVKALIPDRAGYGTAIGGGFLIFDAIGNVVGNLDQETPAGARSKQTGSNYHCSLRGIVTQPQAAVGHQGMSSIEPFAIDPSVD